VRHRSSNPVSEAPSPNTARSSAVPLFPIARPDGTPSAPDEGLGTGLAVRPWSHHSTPTPIDDALLAAPASLALLRDGFEDRALPWPGDDHPARLWRLGRWLATQTSQRPKSLEIIDDWTVVVDRRVLQIDASGHIRDLSPRSGGQGTRLASLACWGRRR
jgi:hypothetical protein